MPELLQMVTILGEHFSQDISAPVGTTIGDVVGSTPMTLLDGSPVDMNSVLGQEELPPGTVLVIQKAVQADDGVGGSAAGKAGVRSQVSPGWTGVVIAAGLGIVGGAPLVLNERFLTITVCVTILMVAVLASVLTSPRVVRSPVGAFLLPGLAGLAVLGCVPPDTPWALDLGVSVALSVAFIAAVALWIWVRTSAARVSILAWGLAAALGVVVVVGGISLTAITPMVMAVGAVLVYLLPRFSASVPEPQLIDTPLLAVSAIGAHLPVTQPPRRVFSSWVSQLVSDAQKVMDVLTVAVCASSVMLALVACQHLDVSDMKGIFFHVCAGCTILLMWLVPRNGQTLLIRVVPRAFAVVLFLILVANLWRTSSIGVMAAVGGVCLVVLMVLCFEVFHQHGKVSSVERFNDVLTFAALAAILPCAVVGSGLFFWVWEVAA